MENFISKSNEVHNYKYNYSNVIYNNNHTKVIIICPIHGEFSVTPAHHVHSKTGCSKCSGKYQYTTQEYIEKAKSIHNNVYDYSKTKYVKSHSKIEVNCLVHGPFILKAYAHLNGNGCRQCSYGGNSGKTYDEFLQRANEIWNGKYQYEKSSFKNFKTPMNMICSIHGTFSLDPTAHVAKKPRGCQACARLVYPNEKKSTEKFVQESKSIHGDLYNYDETIYENSGKEVKIVCKIHGSFMQKPSKHLAGHKCPECQNRVKMTKSKFLESASSLHGDKFDYSNIDFQNSRKEIEIVCKIHGRFMQTPYQHINTKFACPECSVYNKKMNTERFINECKSVHGDKYDYSNVVYTCRKQHVLIHCKEHGPFLQIASVHKNGSQCPKCINHGVSEPAFEWLEFQSIHESIQHQRNSSTGEYTIPGTKYKVDGICFETNTVYEFNGDFWHGNPKIFNPHKINPITKSSFGHLHEKTKRKKEILQKMGYFVVDIWESDWKKSIKSLRKIQKLWRSKHSEISSIC